MPVGQGQEDTPQISVRLYEEIEDMTDSQFIVYSTESPVRVAEKLPPLVSSFADQNGGAVFVGGSDEISQVTMIMLKIDMLAIPIFGDCSANIRLPLRYKESL